MTTSREIHLKSRPMGKATLDDFELATVDVPAPGPGQVQVRNLWMSVDPYMRSRMFDRPSYTPPFQLGKPLEGGAVGRVIASADPAFGPGDLVQSSFGWREVFDAPASALQKLPDVGLPPEAFLGVAGMPGLTAYVGLLRIAGLKEGDVVFVSGAAGAVGSAACQIAKLKGHTVIGSAGGSHKIAFMKEIGVDHTIDYKATPDLAAALAKAAPRGIDVYFDNVGGPHLEAALTAARNFARVALCGMISQYNDAVASPGPSDMSLVVSKRLRLQGFIVQDHSDLVPSFLKDMAEWIASGKVKRRETVDEGIEHAPDAFLKLFEGANVGKMLVKLA
jgi:NADPH-dependent curcumin reductase CurA